ncbi:MAG: molybdate ABC transporter permease subunit [Chloroflexi bacterium]|nr:molybdate ABC transporter permease subunit [Chloroflexota bacterium]
MESSLPQVARPLPRRRTVHYTLSLWLLAAPLLLLIAAPVLALVARVDFSLFLANLTSNVVIRAISLSLVTSLIATLLALCFGLPLAYLLARRQFRGKMIVDTLIDLPMILPPAVAGIALLLAFGRRGLIGAPLAEFGITLAFTQVAVIMAQTFVAAPYFVKAATAALLGVERELEQSAALDGASPLQVFVAITIPLSWPVLSSGLVMTWARALGEFGATIIFAGNLAGRTQTMPLAIYLGFERDLQLAIVLALVLLGVAFLVLLIVKGWLRQRVGAV